MDGLGGFCFGALYRGSSNSRGERVADAETTGTKPADVGTVVVGVGKVVVVVSVSVIVIDGVTVFM